MSKYRGRSRARLAVARQKLRRGWGRARARHAATRPASPEPSDTATCPATEAESPPRETAVVRASETCASPPPEFPEPAPVMTAAAPPLEGERAEQAAATSEVASENADVPPPAQVSRRRLIQAGLATGFGGGALVGLPGVLRELAPPPLTVERLFNGPRDYLASNEFPAPSPMPAPAAKAPPSVTRQLALFNENTGETVKATYWADGDYVLEELESVHRILRDHHVEEIRAIDLKLVELIYAIQAKLDSNEPVHILSAYRSPLTNARLGERFGGVATNSFHIKGKAADIRVPGRSKRQLRRAALSLKAGGVGNYPRYIHIDTGPVRAW